MTPIPPEVAALIGATGHYIEATVTASSGTNRAAWIWSSRGLVESPSWRVDIGDGYGRGATARAATLDALARLAAADDKRERVAREEAKRLRRPDYKASATRDAETAAKRAAEVRALAAQVAAMWPEVGP